MSLVSHWVMQHGYLGIFTLLMLGIFGLPVPDETLLLFTGFLAHQGNLNLLGSISAAFSGSVCGISLSFFMGRLGGYYIVEKYGHWLHITPQRFERVHAWFNRNGRWGLIIGYFLPGIRHVTAILAGATRMRYPSFAIFAYLGALLWSSAFIVAGYIIGEEWQAAAERIRSHLLIASIAVLAVAGLIYVGQYLYRRKKMY